MNPNDELAAALGGDEPDFTEEPYAPLDLDQATQWLTQLAEARSKRAEYEAALAAATLRLQERARKAFDGFDRAETWLTQALEIFHQTALTLDPKATKIETPAGDLTSNAGQQRWVYEDEAALLKWALVNANAAVNFPVAPEPTLKKNDLKKILKETATFSDGVVVAEDGTLVPGVKVLPARRTFEPKPAE